MILQKDINIRDPYIYSEGGCYYLYSSGIGESGVPVFICRRSKNMKEFEEPVVIFEPPANFWATKDFWAPEVHKYNGRYYLFGSLKSDVHTRGTQIFVSDSPDGKFLPLTEFPVTPNAWECLDGTLYVENEIPYLIFCREWLEIADGEIYIMQLTQDLVKAAGEPVKLFSASSAQWTRPLSENNYVTDGPFIIKSGETYNMIWSSFSEKGYAMGRCKSKSLFGPWEHDSNPINTDNGGHGMILTKDDRKYIVYHAPNNPCGSERMKFMPIDLR